MTIDPVVITAGTDVTVTINDIELNKDHQLTVRSEDGQTTFHTFDFKQPIVCSSKPSPSDTFEVGGDWCDPANPQNYIVHINTSGYNCQPGSTTQSKCSIHLTSTNQDLSTLLTVTPTDDEVFRIGFVIPANAVVRYPEKLDPENWANPFAPFNFYGNKDVFVQATGCEGTAEFKSWRGNKLDCDANGCIARLYETADDKGFTNGNTPTAHTFDFAFGTTPTSDIQYMTAVCESGAEASTPFRVYNYGNGKEYVKFPVIIEPGKSFDITLGGLGEKWQSLFSATSICYYFQIIDPLGIPVTPQGEGVSGSLLCDDKDKEHVGNNRVEPKVIPIFYQGSNAWWPETVIPIKGLDYGRYKFKLSASAWDDGVVGRGSADLEDPPLLGEEGEQFCVGACRNDDTQFPPGKAPCVIGKDAEGHLIDTRVDPTDGLQGTPGPRDKIAKCTAVPTAFGVVGVDPKQIVETLLGITLGFVGGIALLLIIYAGYKMVTSHGNPEQIESARETLTSAIIGLLFIIFSVVILEVIGVDILRIPGFDTDSQDTSYNEIERQRVERQRRENATPKRPDQPPGGQETPRSGDTNPPPPQEQAQPIPHDAFAITIIDSISGNIIYTKDSGVQANKKLRRGIPYRIYFVAPDITHLFAWGIKFRTDNPQKRPCTPTGPPNGCMVEYTVPSNIDVPGTVIVDVVDTDANIIASTPPIPVE